MAAAASAAATWGGLVRASVWLVLASVLSACATPAASAASTSEPQAAGGAHAAAAPTAAPALAVVVVEATYGHLAVRTRAGASCAAKAELPGGDTILAADFLSSHDADAGGNVSWSYHTPVAGAQSGSGRYVIRCTNENERAEETSAFAIP